MSLAQLSLLTQLHCSLLTKSLSPLSQAPDRLLFLLLCHHHQRLPELQFTLDAMQNKGKIKFWLITICINQFIFRDFAGPVLPSQMLIPPAQRLSVMQWCLPASLDCIKK